MSKFWEMRKRFQFQSILQKMLTSYGVIILLILLMGLVAVWSSVRVSRATDAITDQHLPIMLEIEEVASSYSTQTIMIYEALAAGEEAGFKDFREVSNQNALAERELLKAYPNEQLEETIALSVAWTQDVNQEVINQNAVGNTEAALENMHRLNDRTTEILNRYTALLTNIEAQIVTSSQEVVAIQSQLLLVIAGITLFSIGVSLLVAWFSSKSIADPIREVQNRLQAISQNDFSFEVLEIASEDEVGKLAEALNQTRENLVSLMGHLKVGADDILENSEQFVTQGKDILSGSNQIAKTMEELATGTEQQANHVVDLAERMGDFSKRTQETLGYGEEIKEGSDEIVEKSFAGRQLMGESNTQMDAISSEVRDAVQQMSALYEQTQAISHLMDFIQGVASQTELLSFNASIEAARAGEQGRGFVVVAAEIRKLADQVSTSVAEITQLVEGIQLNSETVNATLQQVDQEVDVGNSKIQQTAQNIQEISTLIQAMQTRNDFMVQNLTEISTVSQEMHQLIDEVSTISEESAAGVEETSATTQEINATIYEVTNQTTALFDLASQLENLVEEVQLDEDTDATL